MTTLYVRDCPPEHVMTANVLDVYSRADSLDHDRGAAWYDDARDHARAIGDIAGVGMHAGAGVIAVLSPQVEWHVNLREAYAMAVAHADDRWEDGDDFSAFHANILKAYHILQSPDRVADIVHGPKVTAFYRAIAGLPGGPVIDRHATRVATGYGFDAVTEATYRAVQAAYVVAARLLGILEHVLQATTWLVCKRELASTVGQLTLGLS